MTLSPQRTSIPFIGGQEQQIAKELVDPPLLLKAHNVIPRKNGGLAKRPGWIAESFSVHGFPYLPQPERLARRGNEVLWIGETKDEYYFTHYPPTLIARAPSEATEQDTLPEIWSTRGAMPRFNTRKLLDITQSNTGESIGAWDCAFAGDSERSNCQDGIVCLLWRSTNYSNTDSTIEYAVVDIATRSVLAQAMLSRVAYNDSFVRVIAVKHPNGEWYFHLYYAIETEINGVCNVWHASIPAKTPWIVSLNEATFNSLTGFDVAVTPPEADEQRVFYTYSNNDSYGIYCGFMVPTPGAALTVASTAFQYFTSVPSGTVIYWTPTIAIDQRGTEAAVHLSVDEPGCGTIATNVLANFYALSAPSHAVMSVSDVAVVSNPDATGYHMGGLQIGWAGSRMLDSVSYRTDNWWLSWESSSEIGVRFCLYQAREGRELVKEIPVGATMSLRPWGRPFTFRAQLYFLSVRGSNADSTGVEILAPYREGTSGGDPATSYRVSGRMARGEVAFSSNAWGRDAGAPLCRGRNSTVESWYQRGRFFTAIPTIALDGKEHRISLFDVDARDPQVFAWTESSGSTYFASSIPWMYSGCESHEIGFPCRPQSTSGEILLSEVDSPDASLGTPPQVFYVKACWEGIDSTGKLVRSGVSTADPITITAPLKTIAVTFLNLCVTTHKDVRLAVYVSNDQGITYIRSQQLISNQQYATLQRSVALDPRRLFQEGEPTIYTDRMLQADQPMPAQFICEWQRRIWLVNGVDVAPSHELILGEEPHFSDELRFQLSHEATGISPYDDRLLIWAKNAIYWLSGDGPNDSGEDGSFTQPQRLPTDFGCIDARSIVRTEKGICFQSERGIELIDRGLGTVVISDGVAKTILDDGYSEILSSAWDPATQICRFLVRNPDNDAYLVLCWHTLYSWWTTASIPGMGRSGVTARPNGLLRACESNWMALGDRPAYDYSPTCKLARETGPVGATYLDRSTPGYTGPNANHWYQAEIETANVKLDGLLGFARVWRAEVLTSEQSAFTGISIACVSDFADTESTPARTWESESEVASAKISPNHHSFQVHVKDQQVNAIRLKIKDIQFPDSWSGSTETFVNFVGFALHWGRQPGSGRRAESAKK